MDTDKKIKYRKFPRYKYPVTTMETLRQSRFEESNSLRKHRREDELRRLRENSGGYMQELQQESSNSTSIFDPEIIGNLDSDDTKHKLDALKQYHILIKTAKNTESTIDDLVTLGLVPLFSAALFAAQEGTPLEAIALTVLADVAGRLEEKLEEIFDHTLITRLFKIYTSSSASVLINLLYTLSTVIHSSIEIRDMCLSQGIVQRTLDVWTRQSEVVVRSLAITVLNSLYCWPIDVSEVSELYLNVLREIFERADESLQIDALSGLTNLCEIPDEHVNLVVLPFLPTITSFCCSSSSLACAALQVISNVATWGCAYTQLLFEHNITETLWNILSNPHENSLSDLKVAASSTFSTILKTDSQSCSVVLQRKYVPKFAQVLSYGQYRVRREAVMALHTILLNGSCETVEYTVGWQDNGNRLITLLADMLTVMDCDTVLATLECIDQILMIDKFHSDNGMDCVHPFFNKQLMEEQGGLDKLDFLLSSQNMEVYILAHDIIENYFEDHGDCALDCEQDQIGDHVATGQFSFSAATNFNG